MKTPVYLFPFKKLPKGAKILQNSHLPAARYPLLPALSLHFPCVSLPPVGPLFLSHKRSLSPVDPPVAALASWVHDRQAGPVHRLGELVLGLLHRRSMVQNPISFHQEGLLGSILLMLKYPGMGQVV